MLSWGEVGHNTHNVHVYLTDSGSSHSGSIIFCNQNVQVDTSPATPAHLPNTDYWLLCHCYITHVGTGPFVDIKVCRNNLRTQNLSVLEIFLL